MDQILCIRLFRRVAEAKSFSAVAPEFGLTQPMVSKRIAWLEEELGVTLLRRSTRGIEVTNEGQKLYRQGGHALDELDAVLSSVKNEKLQLSGVLRVTASLAFARIILSPYLSGLNEQNPDLRMHFTLSDGYVDLVEKNIDLAFRIGELPDSSLKAIRVAMSRRKIYASETYLKKFGVPKSIKDLDQHRCLFYTRISDQTAWPLTDGKEKKSPYHFEPYIQSDASELIREAVINNQGLALLPTWMIEDRPDTKKIISVLDKYAPIPTPIYAVTTGQRELTAKQRNVIDYFRKCFDLNKQLSLRAN